MAIGPDRKRVLELRAELGTYAAVKQAKHEARVAALRGLHHRIDLLNPDDNYFAEDLRNALRAIADLLED